MYTTLKEVLKEAELLHMAIGAFNTHKPGDAAGHY